MVTDHLKDSMQAMLDRIVGLIDRTLRRIWRRGRTEPGHVRSAMSFDPGEMEEIKHFARVLLFRCLAAYRELPEAEVARRAARVVRCKYIDELRQAKAKKRGGMEHALLQGDEHALALVDDDPLLLAVQAEKERRLLQALNAMSPCDQRVLWLRYVEGRMESVVAKEMGLSVAAVNHIAQRGKKHLRRELEKPKNWRVED